MVDWTSNHVSHWFAVVRGRLELYRLAAIGTAGRYFYLFLLIAPLWLMVNWLMELWSLGGSIDYVDVPGRILGLPLSVLGIYLGLRIIASEINGRTLEIVYTVPGGCEKVWWAKLVASFLVLVPTAVLLALGTWALFTPFPLLAFVYGLQAPVFYMVLAMGFSTLFRSEVGGAITTIAVLFFNGMFSAFGSNQNRASPFFNPYVLQERFTNEELLGLILQNRIGYALLILAILALTFMRSNRREKLLSV